MTNEKRTFYKFRDKNKFIKSVKEFGVMNSFAQKCDIHLTQMKRYIIEDSNIEKTSALKIANALNVEFDEMFEYVKIKSNNSRKHSGVKEQEKSNFQISEEIICGLKKKIEDRLLISHSKNYVNEIISVIDDIVIESAYLGVNSREDNTHQFIVNAITKRRNT